MISLSLRDAYHAIMPLAEFLQLNGIYGIPFYELLFLCDLDLLGLLTRFFIHFA